MQLLQADTMANGGKSMKGSWASIAIAVESYGSMSSMQIRFYFLVSRVGIPPLYAIAQSIFLVVGMHDGDMKSG